MADELEVTSNHYTQKNRQCLKERGSSRQRQTQDLWTLFSYLCLLSFPPEWDVLRKQLILRHFQAEKSPSTMLKQNITIMQCCFLHWQFIELVSCWMAMWSHCKNSQFLVLDTSITNFFFVTLQTFVNGSFCSLILLLIVFRSTVTSTCFIFHL